MALHAICTYLNLKNRKNTANSLIDAVDSYENNSTACCCRWNALTLSNHFTTFASIFLLENTTSHYYNVWNHHMIQNWDSLTDNCYRIHICRFMFPIDKFLVLRFRTFVVVKSRYYRRSSVQRTCSLEMRFIVPSTTTENVKTFVSSTQIQEASF